MMRRLGNRLSRLEAAAAICDLDQLSDAELDLRIRGIADTLGGVAQLRASLDPTDRTDVRLLQLMNELELAA